MVYSDTEIQNIIDEVSSTVLGLAKSTLEKAEGSSSMSKGSSDGGSAPEASASGGGDMPPGIGGDDSASASASGSSDGEGSSVSPVDAGDPSSPAVPPGESAAAMPPAPGSADPSADPAAAGMDDHAALVAEFAKMPPEHVASILEAAKQVLMAQQEPSAAAASAPPEGPASAGPASPGPAGPEAGGAAPMAMADNEGLNKVKGAAGKGVSQPADKDAVPAGPADRHQSAKAQHPVPKANGGDPMSPQKGSSADLKAKLASPATKAEGGGDVLNPPRESGAMKVPDKAILSPADPIENHLTGLARKAEEAEKRFEALQKANEDLKTKLEQLTGVMVDLVEKPIRKAVTGLDYVAKPVASEAPRAMSRDEVTRVLNEKVRDPSLTKSDRQAINDFYDRRIGLDKIQHLLKDA